METILIVFLGLLVTLSIFYAKEADALSDSSLRFIKIVASIVAIATIILGWGYVIAIIISWFK